MGTMSRARLKFRPECSPAFLPFYEKLCELLPDDWQPCCVLRTFKEQAEVYASGRTKPGPIKSKAAPGLSGHQYGCAADFFKPKWGSAWPDRESEEWVEYSRACLLAGLKKLEFEQPHTELRLYCTWAEVKDVFEHNGMDAAQAFILKNVRR